jgi:hypothetical protein
MGNGPGPAEMLEIELIVREHVVAATAALNQPGGRGPVYGRADPNWQIDSRRENRPRHRGRVGPTAI